MLDDQLRASKVGIVQVYAAVDRETCHLARERYQRRLIQQRFACKFSSVVGVVVRQAFPHRVAEKRKDRFQRQNSDTLLSRGGYGLKVRRRLCL